MELGSIYVNSYKNGILVGLNFHQPNSHFKKKVKTQKSFIPIFEFLLLNFYFIFLPPYFNISFGTGFSNKFL